jgi:hypothetical protein
MSHKSSEEKNTSPNLEKERIEQESLLKDTVDPQDLAYTNRTVSNPDKLLGTQQ